MLEAQKVLRAMKTEGKRSENRFLKNSLKYTSSKSDKKFCLNFGKDSRKFFMESLILAQNERWRRA